MPPADIATEPGSAAPNEDWAAVLPSMIVMLDGQTVRTTTGCEHGVPWYVDRLGNALARLATPPRPLVDALAEAIRRVRTLHPRCDLDHEATPSAAVGIVRANGDQVDMLVLGDITIAVGSPSGVHTLTDNRVSESAVAARLAADRFPIGSQEKAAALLTMKAAELAARNTPDGFWIAAADPAAARHAYTRSLPAADVSRLLVCTDGAARAVTFGLMTWPAVLDLVAAAGVRELICRVRQAETTDPLGIRWPRNKISDDATAAYTSAQMGNLAL